MFVVADNLRKGAATNAVQIAEVLIRDGLLASKPRVEFQGLFLPSLRAGVESRGGAARPSSADPADEVALEAAHRLSASLPLAGDVNHCLKSLAEQSIPAISPNQLAAVIVRIPFCRLALAPSEGLRAGRLRAWTRVRPGLALV